MRVGNEIQSNCQSALLRGSIAGLLYPSQANEVSLLSVLCVPDEAQTSYKLCFVHLRRIEQNLTSRDFNRSYVPTLTLETILITLETSIATDEGL